MAHLELYHRKPDALKRPDVMLDQSCDPNDSHNRGQLRPLRELFPSLQTNCYVLLLNFCDRNIEIFSLDLHVIFIHLRYFFLLLTGKGYTVPCKSKKPVV